MVLQTSRVIVVFELENDGEPVDIGYPREPGGVMQLLKKYNR